jgi:hypothetical protein
VKHIFGALIFCLLGGWVDGQTIVQPKQLDYSSVGVLYEKEKSFDFRPHTNGMALGVHFGKIKTYYKTNYYQFDLGFVRHPKEYRQTVTFNSGSPFTRSTGSFTYGKQNDLIIFRGGVGKKYYYSDKAKRKGVAVGVDYELGPSIGMLKPYYLELSRLRENGFIDYISTERYTPDNKDIFLDETKIVGPASFFKGFTKLSFIPGFHARIGAHFSLGQFDQYIKALEIGVMVDGFFQRVPIMIIENNTPVFINGYLSFQIGKRQ